MILNTIDKTIFGHEDVKITANAIIELPKKLQDVVLEVALYASFFVEKHGPKSFEGVNVVVTTLENTIFTSKFVNIEESNLIFSDVKGHLRILKIQCLKDLEIINKKFIKTIMENYERR